MEIRILSVGRQKEGFFRDASSHYLNQIEKKHKVSLIEVPDEKAPETLSEREMIQIKEKEGEKLLEKIKGKDYVIALAIDGKRLEEASLKQKLNHVEYDSVTFVIGGSLGLSDAVLRRANEHISFGKATFPHQLMKVVLLSHIEKVCS